ncbi:MAG: hypothetical protein HGA45_30930, partial [Chloroflexales bacterium]|nr:hypothetical protein [Chloroflexales bacterium]
MTATAPRSTTGTASRYALTAHAPRHHRQVLATLAGGRVDAAYLPPPVSRRVRLELALHADQPGSCGAGFEVTTVQGWRIFVSLAQAVALLVGRPVEAQVPRLSHPLPTIDRLTDIGGDQVVYALGVNQPLPMAARQCWYWSSDHEERPLAAMTAEDAAREAFQLRSRVGLPKTPQAVDPAWILANCGVCVGVRRDGSITWRALMPLAALATAITGQSVPE